MALDNDIVSSINLTLLNEMFPDKTEGSPISVPAEAPVAPGGEQVPDWLKGLTPDVEPEAPAAPVVAEIVVDAEEQARAAAASPVEPAPLAPPAQVLSVEEQFAKLKKAEELIEAKQFDEALNYIKRDTEKSSIRQVRVKAKFLLGELLLQQNEYDLAMQMFEEIINQYAFSGLVIKTLGRLILCSEKLKLEDKKTKYFSMLNDIFGTG